MKPEEIDPLVLEMVKRVSGKRAVTVADFIIEHGMITTDDLERLGYIHPPRAVRDVRENGIPIITFRVKGADGKSIAASSATRRIFKVLSSEVEAFFLKYLRKS